MCLSAASSEIYNIFILFFASQILFLFPLPLGAVLFFRPCDTDPSVWTDPDPSAWRDPDLSAWRDPDPSAWRDPDPSAWSDPVPSAWSTYHPLPGILGSRSSSHC